MTTTEPNPHVPVPGEAVAELPARKPHAQVRARTREAEPTAGPRLAAIQRAVPQIISGSSLWHAQPPSMAMYWAKHCASARYFEAALLRYPRYGWGVVHLVVLVPVYLLGWVSHSIPLLVLVVSATALSLWLW